MSPYELESPPESKGRVLLACGFAHYCALHWGFSGQEIKDAFTGLADEHVRACVDGAAALFGGLFARGAIRGWARPLGGGAPERLKEVDWELDDFSARFASSCIDPKRPFDPGAAPTHWIFADLDDWNAAVEASVADALPRGRVRESSSPPPPKDLAPVSLPTQRDHDRLIRMPEVEHRTGLSRATIYRKIEAKRFPAGIPLSGNVTGWREKEVDAWIGQPT